MEPMKPMKPMAPLDFGKPWWPADLGQPTTRGGQNEVNYAFFPGKRVLAIQKDGLVTLHDAGDHEISGVQQQQGSATALVFSSQHGTVDLQQLRRL